MNDMRATVDRLPCQLTKNALLVDLAELATDGLSFLGGSDSHLRFVYRRWRASGCAKPRSRSGSSSWPESGLRSDRDISHWLLEFPNDGGRRTDTL